MKRLPILIGILVMLTACAASPAAEQPMVSAAVSMPAPPKREETLSWQVEKLVSEDSATEEDGTPLVHYRFDLPFLKVLRENDAAAEMAAEERALASAEVFNSHFGKWAAAEEFESLVASAREDLAFYREEGLEWFGGHELELTTTVYQTKQLVSVAGLYYSYTGGAHPNTWHLGWNFDLVGGTFLNPGDLAADSAVFQEAVHQELIRQAEEVAAESQLPPEEMFWADYREILANWDCYAVCFDEGGMTVTFSPYELAAYGAGAQVFTVSNEWLRPYLSLRGLALLDLL